MIRRCTEMVKSPLELFFPMRTFLVVSGRTEEDRDVMTANWIIPISSKPPYYVALAINPKRFTFRNIEKYGEFVIAVPDWKLLKVVKHCGIVSKAKDPNKLEGLNLTFKTSRKINTPGILEAVANIECKAVNIEKWGNRFLVIARIVDFSYKQDAWIGRTPNLTAYPLIMQRAWLSVLDYIQVFDDDV